MLISTVRLFNEFALSLDYLVMIFGAVSEGCYTIATVGDDNAVVMTLCKLVCLDPSSPTLAVEHQFSEPSAHSSSITGTVPL